MHVICAHCGVPLQAFNNADGNDRPIPGDMAQCDACGQLTVFTEDGVRRPTRSELAVLKSDWGRPKTGTPTMITFDGRG